MHGKLKSVAIAAGVAMLALTGAVGGAEAGGKHFHFHKHHFHHNHHLFVAPVVVHDGCGYYKHMWWKTGFLFWKQKYYVCKGWW
jgi:hypothetical protein